MSKEKIAISIDKECIGELDRLITDRIFANRSQAIQQAISEKLANLKRDRFLEECRKLRPEEEQAMAEEGLAEDFKSWPEY